LECYTGGWPGEIKQNQDITNRGQNRRGGILKFGWKKFWRLYKKKNVKEEKKRGRKFGVNRIRFGTEGKVDRWGTSMFVSSKRCRMTDGTGEVNTSGGKKRTILSSQQEPRDKIGLHETEKIDCGEELKMEEI